MGAKRKPFRPLVADKPAHKVQRLKNMPLFEEEPDIYDKAFLAIIDEHPEVLDQCTEAGIGHTGLLVLFDENDDGTIDVNIDLRALSDLKGTLQQAADTEENVKWIQPILAEIEKFLLLGRIIVLFSGKKRLCVRSFERERAPRKTLIN